MYLIGNTILDAPDTNMYPRPRDPYHSIAFDALISVDTSNSHLGHIALNAIISRGMVYIGILKI